MNCNKSSVIELASADWKNIGRVPCLLQVYGEKRGSKACVHNRQGGYFLNTSRTNQFDKDYIILALLHGVVFVLNYV